MPTTNDPVYQKAWRKNHPNYQNEWQSQFKKPDSRKRRDLKAMQIKIEAKQEREAMAAITCSHRQTIFTGGAAREGLIDRPYTEGEIL